MRSKTLEVAMRWGEAVIGVAHFDRPRRVTIGDSLRNRFRLAGQGLGAGRFPLIEPADGRFAVSWAEPMAIEVRGADGEPRDEQALAQCGQVAAVGKNGTKRRRYTMALEDQVAVRLGDVSFAIQYVAAARDASRPWVKSRDFFFPKIVALVLLVLGFGLAALRVTPADPQGLSEELLRNPARFAKLIPKQARKPPDKKKLEVAERAAPQRERERYRRAERKSQSVAAKDAPRVNVDKRERDRKVALQAGIFAALKDDRRGAAASVLGAGGLGSGIDNALVGLRGATAGDVGAGGVGTRGGGQGGGSVGIGSFGGAVAVGNIDLAARGRDRFAVAAGKTVVRGCVSQDAVGRVLDRIQSQVKYCYEKELQRNPSLAGKITTKFIIGPAGAVQSVQVEQSTLNDSAVEDCVVRVIQRLRFPPCEGGGTAEVSYPWMFKSGGT